MYKLVTMGNIGNPIAHPRLYLLNPSLYLKSEIVRCSTVWIWSGVMLVLIHRVFLAGVMFWALAVSVQVKREVTSNVTTVSSTTSLRFWTLIVKTVLNRVRFNAQFLYCSLIIRAHWMRPVQRTLTQKTKTKINLTLSVTGDSLVSYVIIAVIDSANHYETVVDLSGQTKYKCSNNLIMLCIITYLSTYMGIF